ncbi:RNA polymerase sigma factor [Streptomyces sp. NPDC087856]|uniref:RNA polymerase sigma factor n=1 Tax=Streptomyces sp. NPDC087856 TaxID=3365811 RepID=UPI00380B0527
MSTPSPPGPCGNGSDLSRHECARFDDLFRASYQGLLAQALLVSGGRFALAQDAAQESLLRCWRRMHQAHLDPVVNWPAWLRRTVMRETLRLTKISATTEPLEEDAPERAAADFDAAAAVDLKDAYRRVCTYIAGLSERQREVLARCAIAGERLGDVAAEMGISEGTARTHLHRARQALHPVWVELKAMGVIDVSEGRHGNE